MNHSVVPTKIAEWSRGDGQVVTCQPRYPHKDWPGSQYLLSQSWGGRGRRIPEAPQTANLAKLESSDLGSSHTNWVQ